MFHFFKKIKKKTRDIFSLCTGDIITFAYDKNKDISGNSFEVLECVTYFYGESFYPEFIVKNDKGKTLFLSVDKDDGEIIVTITKKIPIQDISSNFIDDFRSFFVSTSSIFHVSEYFSSDYSSWFCSSGYGNKNQGKGHFLNCDIRNINNFNSIEGSKEAFRYSFCTTKCNNYGIECEKYSSAEDYSFFIYRNEYIIEEVLFKND